jgi:cytidine deaminase
MDSQIQALIDSARPLVRPIQLARADMSAATVAAALVSTSGRIYTGVCVHVSCGIGFCAEHAAIAEMVKGGETEVAAIVAVSSDGVLAPCGRCRELMAQVNARNLDAKVGLPDGRAALLSELLPEHWLSRESL